MPILFSNFNQISILISCCQFYPLLIRSLSNFTNLSFFLPGFKSTFIQAHIAADVDTTINPLTQDTAIRFILLRFSVLFVPCWVRKQFHNGLWNCGFLLLKHEVGRVEKWSRRKRKISGMTCKRGQGSC
jgi:hypothetical protein